MQRRITRSLEIEAPSVRPLRLRAWRRARVVLSANDNRPDDRNAVAAAGWPATWML